MPSNSGLLPMKISGVSSKVLLSSAVTPTHRGIVLFL